MSVICFKWKDLWILVISIADMISDFVYFAELLNGNDVSDAVAYAVLAFAVCGVLSMLMGPSTRFGLATAMLLEDVPQIIATTAIEAYVVGARVDGWAIEAIVSYAFSVFALQQKMMKIGFAPINRYNVDEENEEKDFCWVFVCSLVFTAIVLGVAWGAALFIIFLTFDIYRECIGFGTPAARR